MAAATLVLLPVKGLAYLAAAFALIALRIVGGSPRFGEELLAPYKPNGAVARPTIDSCAPAPQSYADLYGTQDATSLHKTAEAIRQYLDEELRRLVLSSFHESDPPGHTSWTFDGWIGQSDGFKVSVSNHARAEAHVESVFSFPYSAHPDLTAAYRELIYLENATSGWSNEGEQVAPEMYFR